eukprot:Gb_17532 [translate_table: standard]
MATALLISMHSVPCNCGGSKTRAGCKLTGKKSAVVSNYGPRKFLMTEGKCTCGVEMELRTRMRLVSFRQTNEDSFPHFQAEFARFSNRVWRDKTLAKKYYEAALHEEEGGHNPRLQAEYAEFTWMELGDVERAEAMFQKASAEAPGDVVVAGSFANFLWHVEEV